LYWYKIEHVLTHYATTGRTAAGIAAALENRILAGRLGPGDALPAVRDLAKSLRVSPATVAAAYRLLRTRGLAAGDRRRGTRVRAQDETRNSRLARAGAGSDLVDLGTGNPDPDLLPPLGAALKSVPLDPVLYGASSDVPALVRFARGEFAADGIEVEHVVVTAGGLDAIERVLREHLRPGDRVAVEDPTSPALLDLLTTSGLIPEPVATDPEGPTPDAMNAVLKRRVAALVITVRAQNPTGAYITETRAGVLRAVLKRHPDVLLIESDPFGPVSGARAVTLTNPGRSHWAIVRSLTKFLGPDLRVAIVAGDELTVARVRARQCVGMRWVSHLLQHVALALWSDPSSGRHLARAADTYARRRQGLITALAAAGTEVTAASGFNVWIPVPHEADVVEQLARRGWAVAAGERFRLKAGPGIRVTTSALAPDDARRFATDLALALGTVVPALA